MSFAIPCSERELCCWFLTPSGEAIAAGLLRHVATMERRAARRGGGGGGGGAHHRRGAAHAHGGEHGGKQQRRHGTTGRGQQQGPAAPALPAGYFTAELVLVFLFVAASLAFLPLLLPPLSPPPFLLLLVPVGLLAVLVALAFVPLDAQSHLVGSPPR